jgi:hypothetical protein
MMTQFILSETELAEIRKIRESVKYLFGDNSIKHEEYIFSSGGGIGPHCVKFRILTKEDVEVLKEVTDYSSW